MHILLIPSFYPSEIRPTTGIFFIDQLNAMRSIGHQVGVLVAPRLYETLDYIRTNRKLAPLMQKQHGGYDLYRLHSLWVPRFFPLISAMIYERTAKIAFDRYCQEHGIPDVIHAHNIFYGGYMAVRIAKKHSIHTILTEHSTNFLRGRIFLPGQHMIAKYTLQHVNQSFAVGKRLADTLNTKYKPNNLVEVIANIVDTDYFVPGKHESIFTFATVGQLTKRKRFDLLINAFTQAFRNQPINLYIGGNGKEYNNLESLINSLGMQSQITLLGHLSRPQVRDLFQQAHVVVSSSNIETFGVTLIEAMSCGNPVIATRSGGPEQFVTPENGILTPVDDQEGLADALIKIYQTYDSYDKEKIRQMCIENFGQYAIAKQLETIYLKHIE